VGLVKDVVTSARLVVTSAPLWFAKGAKLPRGFCMDCCNIVQLMIITSYCPVFL